MPRIKMMEHTIANGIHRRIELIILDLTFVVGGGLLRSTPVVRFKEEDIIMCFEVCVRIHLDDSFLDNQVFKN